MAAHNRTENWQVHDQAGRRKYLNGDELRRFLAAAEGFAPGRQAFCEVLAYTGCRISEALALTIHHLDTEQGTLTFRTLKRRRICFRTVPVPQALVEQLTALGTAEDGRFWVLHRATAWRIVKATVQRAGIVGPMACPKGLRHGFGIRAVGRNVPTNLIQRWMGHASPETTAVYLDAVGVEERLFASRMW